MRTFPFHVLLLALLLCVSHPATAQSLDPYVGSWTSEDTSLSCLQVTQEEGIAYLQIWGKIQGVMLVGEKFPARSLWLNSYDESQMAPGQLSAVLPLQTGQVELTLALDPAASSLRAQVRLPEAQKVQQLRFFRRPLHSRLGSISGKALGPASSVASIFRVALYGPNDGSRAVGITSFDQDQTFCFNQLPDGVYWMQVEAPGFSVVQSFPEETTIVIRNGEARVQNIEMR
jgi:hypothetical protein